MSDLCLAKYDPNVQSEICRECRATKKDVESNHPEWGEPETPHYVIKLGGRVELVD